MVPSYRQALIVGAGSGLSASLARLFSKKGLRVTLAARGVEKLAPLCEETGAQALSCDVSDPQSVAALFAELDAREATPDVVVFNPSARVRGPFTELDPEEVRKAMTITAFGGFLVAQQAARRMVERGGGAILLTGASASVKGYPLSASFAMGKFALRGMAESLARELQPKGIHVCHFVTSGTSRQARLPARSRRHRAQLLARAGTGPQRLDAGDRAQALGRDFLGTKTPPRRNSKE
jgi:NAD(P)-dependent dehydrogenase (short-subunit alcohol dehydrogenase family)